MKKAIVWLGMLAWALGGTACAVSTEETDSEEQVGETSEEIRNYNLPGTGFGTLAENRRATCLQACGTMRTFCEGFNNMSPDGVPMDPCDLNYAICVSECPPA